MALEEERKQSLLAYCRIDDLAPGEDALLDAMYNSAVAYMANAGVSQPEAGTARAAQYDLVINAMVLDAWDNRGGHRAGATLTDNPFFRRLITQMKLTEPVSKLDTGTGV